MSLRFIWKWSLRAYAFIMVCVLLSSGLPKVERQFAELNLPGKAYGAIYAPKSKFSQTFDLVAKPRYS